MIVSWRMFLGTLTTGIVLSAVGCFVNINTNKEPLGQGGATTTTTTSTSTSTGTGGAGGGVSCSSAAPCEDVDMNPCTQEACTNGVCVSVPLTLNPGPGSTECITVICENGALPTKMIHTGKACGMGLMCSPQGECAGCTKVKQCGMEDECQKPTCRADMTCSYEYMPLGTKVNALLPTDLPDDCMATICDGYGKIVLYLDTTDAPDSTDCTVGQCVEGKPVQTLLAVGTACVSEVGFCNAAKSCAVCATDANCPAGKTCYNETVCVSCTDTTKNGNETDVDCGGSCVSKCLDGKACKVNGDCASGLCPSGTCLGCSDGVKNGDEVGIDCGGSCVKKCDNGTPCTNPADCVDAQCADGVCCNTACTGTCTACNLPMKVGTCSQLAKGHDDSSPVCSGTKTCDSGACVGDGNKGHYGAACTMGSQCFSNICSGQTFTCN